MTAQYIAAIICQGVSSTEVMDIQPQCRVAQTRPTTCADAPLKFDVLAVTDTYYPPLKVDLLCTFLLQFLPSDSILTTVVFPESGTATTELALCSHMIQAGHWKCSSVILMDNKYQECDRNTFCIASKQTFERQFGILVHVLSCYKHLTQSLKYIGGSIVIVGIHQGTCLQDSVAVQDYMEYLQLCANLVRQGRLLTPYTNIMWCTNVGQLLSVYSKKEFIQTMEAPLHIKAVPWDRAYVIYL